MLHAKETGISSARLGLWLEGAFIFTLSVNKKVMICILLPFVNVVKQVTERVKIIPHIVKSLCNLQQTRTHLYIHYSGVLTIDS